MYQTTSLLSIVRRTEKNKRLFYRKFIYSTECPRSSKNYSRKKTTVELNKAITIWSVGTIWTIWTVKSIWSSNDMADKKQKQFDAARMIWKCSFSPQSLWIPWYLHNFCNQEEVFPLNYPRWVIKTVASLYHIVSIIS